MQLFRREDSNSQQVAKCMLEFHPFTINEVIGEQVIDAERLLSCLGENNAITDISCIGKEESEYSGNPIDRESINLPIKSFVEGFLQLSQQKSHWLLESGLNFYLSQCCLYSSDPRAIQIPLPAVYDNKPEVLQHTSIDTVNLWMNLQPSRSTLHYDANHNLLVVLRGTKTISLLSPELSYLLQPKTIFSETPNHSFLSFQEVNNLIQNKLTINQKFVNKYHIVTLQAGQAIFIPEGWWHQVESTEFTIGLNYWFKSCLRVEEANSTVLSYLLRNISNKLVIQYCQSNFQEEMRDNIAKNNLYHQLRSYSDLTELLREALNQPEKQETIHQQILCCNYEIMKTIWIPFANENGQEWVKYLLGLSPKSSYILLELWDQIEKELPDTESTEFFQSIFSPCGDSTVQIRQHLIHQKDEWIREQGQQYLNSVLFCQK